MQEVRWTIHQQDDGTIDYGFYRAEANRKRLQAKRIFARAIRRRLSRQLSRFATLLSRLATLYPVFHRLFAPRGFRAGHAARS